MPPQCAAVAGADTATTPPLPLVSQSERKNKSSQVKQLNQALTAALAQVAELQTAGQEAQARIESLERQLAAKLASAAGPSPEDVKEAQAIAVARLEAAIGRELSDVERQVGGSACLPACCWWWYLACVMACVLGVCAGLSVMQSSIHHSNAAAMPQHTPDTLPLSAPTVLL